jgi:hypothetical protein
VLVVVVPHNHITIMRLVQQREQQTLVVVEVVDLDAQGLTVVNQLQVVQV